MSSPWGKTPPTNTVNLMEIMSEQYAHRVHDQEVKRLEKAVNKRKEVHNKNDIWGGNVGEGAAMTYSQAAAQPQLAKEEGEWQDFSALLKDEAKETEEPLPPEVLELLQKDAIAKAAEDSDALIAQLLQSQFDHEHNEELRRIERQQNKQSKVTVTLDKFHRHGDFEFLQESDDSYDDNDDDERQKRDWDRFETNNKKLENLPKCGFRIDKTGGITTKHDEELCGVRNACKVMSFPPEFPTGDAAGFDMKLSNQVFNQLRRYSHRTKKNKEEDRTADVATAEMGMDAPTRLLLYKLINNQVLEQINGIISTGKEAIILHANSDPAYAGQQQKSNNGKTSGNDVLLPPRLLPKECAIKVFKTTLNEFKQRDRYIKDDYRFKDRFSKQNNRVIINMWAEKEMHNMMRMQSVGINCPDMIILKKHVLVMSFIGDNHNAAPKLKEARLSAAELSIAYEEIIAAMYKMYNEANLVHADLSEYNILWYDGKCWFIDVAQSVEPEHPGALEFLMRDCDNIITFFTKRGLPNIFTKEQLFEHITALNAETHNVAMLERIHTRGASVKQATAPNLHDCPDEQKPITFPFELAWEMSQAERQKKSIDQAAIALQTKCSIEAADKTDKSQNKSPLVANVAKSTEH